MTDPIDLANPPRNCRIVVEQEAPDDTSSLVAYFLSDFHRAGRPIAALADGADPDEFVDIFEAAARHYGVPFDTEYPRGDDD